MPFADNISLLNNSFSTSYFFCENIVSKLRKEFLNKPVNVEYCCGTHVKKAIGGILAKVGCDLIELVRSDDRAITIILFGDYNQRYRELEERIIIPLHYICSVEDPCRPCKKPFKDNYYHNYCTADTAE
jgi:hypothetical protein